jgi:hypothetical protein
MANLDQYYSIPFDGEMDPREIAVRAIYLLPSLSLWTPQQMELIDDFTDTIGGEHFLKESTFLIPNKNNNDLARLPLISLTGVENDRYIHTFIIKLGPKMWLVNRPVSLEEKKDDPDHTHYGQTCSWSRLLNLIYKMDIRSVTLGNLSFTPTRILPIYTCELDTGTNRDCNVIRKRLGAVDKFRKVYLSKKFRRGVESHISTLPPRDNFSGGQLYRQARNEFETLSRQNYRHSELDLTEEKTSEPSRRAPVKGSLEEDLVLELSGIRD